MASEYPSQLPAQESSSRLAVKSTTCPWTGHRPSNQQVILRTDSKPLVLRAKWGFTLSILFRVQHTLITSDNAYCSPFFQEKGYESNACLFKLLPQ